MKECRSESAFLTIRQTAAVYGVPEHAVRVLAKDGAFPVIRRGSRCYISRTVFERYLDSGGAACS